MNKVDLAARDGLRCRYCLRDAPDVDSLTVEHIVPLCRGGTNHHGNLGLSCRNCNHEKGPLTEAEFLPVRRNHRERKELTRRVNAELALGPIHGPKIPRRTVVAPPPKPPKPPRTPRNHPHFRWCSRCRVGWHGACLLRCSCPEFDCGKVLLVQRIVLPEA